LANPDLSPELIQRAMSLILITAIRSENELKKIASKMRANQLTMSTDPTLASDSG
jgi:hypothetical protein